MALPRENRTNRDGTAPPVLNIQLWRRKTVPGTCEKIGFTDFSMKHFK